jgi:O-antigen ligase
MAILIVLPFDQKFISPFIGVWIVSSIVVIFTNRLKLSVSKPMLGMIMFYLLLILGLLWTSNLESGVFDLEVKMALFIFPFFHLFIKYTKKDIRKLIYSLIVGVLLTASYLFYYSYLNYLISDSIEEFFYINLSTKIHPSYISYYFVVIFVTLLVDLRFKILNVFNSKFIYLLLLLFLFLFNILLLSKIGVIAATVALVFLASNWVVFKRKYLVGLSTIFLTGMLLYFSYSKSIYFKQRVDEMYIGLFDNNSEYDDSSTGIRIQIWEQSYSLIAKSPIVGYGTGDVKDVLVQSYNEKGMTAAYNKKLNAHNQFLQITISLGFIGLCIFLYSIFTSLKIGFKIKNYFLVAFLITSLLFLFPESMLENQAGTIGFGLFFSLFNNFNLNDEFNSIT